jgi:tetratricopeptide (TPR) repeat protein
MLGVQGINISPDQLRGKLYIPGKEGAVTTEMIAQARKFGLLVYPLDPDFINLLAEINAGNPVLVMQNLGFNWLPMWHFSVAIAYDLNAQKISLRSGDEVKHDVDFSLFLKTWQRANSWAIVIVPPENLPKTATALGVTKAATQLEQVGEIETAFNVYNAALKKWPENNIANFGAGNAAFALGYYDQAEAFFSDFLKFHPDSAIAWNNLSYRLDELGCISEAKAAINCALKMDPENQNLLNSRIDILQYRNSKPVSACKPIDCL